MFGGKNIKILNRKVSLLPILLIAVVSGSLVVAQLLFSVNLPSSVTVKTVGELAVTDLSGIKLTSLQFSELDPDGVDYAMVEVLIKNLSNSELKVNVFSTSIIPLYAKNLSTSAWVVDTPLAAGAELWVELMLIIEDPVAAGIHNFDVTFTGSS